MSAPRAAYDRARWYEIEGCKYPSVTTVLQVINKPALGPWYAKEERRLMETALLEVLSRDGAHDPEWVLGEMAKALTGVKAADKKKQEAASIGSAAHAWIEWRTKRMLGKDIGPEPVIPDAAQWAVEAWKDWAKAVEFKPVMAERVVYCPTCCFAGTLDWVGFVRGVLTLGDYKTSKAVYAEAYLQNIAYRHALQSCEGVTVERGLILRLPKVIDDPDFEAVPVPETPLAAFHHALGLWRWNRIAEGLPTGATPRGGSLCCS